eukprot:Tbor_TRINITY_DN5189_c2_g6::TRINITY_DN5189_c2_g6_i4::g.25916::m.25916
MLHYTKPLNKNPVVYKYGNDRFSDQLKKLLTKNHLHRRKWTPLHMYNPRRLIHTNKEIDHYNYTYKYNPHTSPNPLRVPKLLPLLPRPGQAINPLNYANNRLFTEEETLNGEEELLINKNKNIHLVPDQVFNNIPVPYEYKDAYWWRGIEARRVQCPVEWVSHRMYVARERKLTDFTDLAFSKMFRYSYDDVVRHMKDDLK